MKKEIWGHIKNFQTVSLATYDGKFPRVRLVTLAHLDDTFWVLTGSGDSKIQQLAKNPAFEFCLVIEKKRGTGTLRACGRARIVKSLKTKAAIAKKAPYFANHWKSPAHPGFALLELSVSAIEYMRPSEMLAKKYIL